MQSDVSERRAFGALIAVALLIVIAAAIGYGFGVAVGAEGAGIGEMKIYRNVAATVGDDQMSAMVDDGTYYGFDSDVSWTDTSGSFHASGWPACLARRSQLHVTFAGALIRTPAGVGIQRILWVDCRT